MNEENIDALLIYPAPHGGWHGDIALKRVPAGVPNVLGSPVSQPYSTRRLAETGVKYTLVTMLKIAANRKRERLAHEGNPTFLFYGRPLPFPPDVQVRINERLRTQAPYASAEDANKALDEVVADIFPDGFEPKLANLLDGPAATRLVLTIYRAVMTGVYAYPIRQPQPPSEGSIC